MVRVVPVTIMRLPERSVNYPAGGHAGTTPCGYAGYMTGTGDTPRARYLGAEIRFARTTAGIGFRALARQLGIPHTTLSHFESGRRSPSPEILGGILGIIGVTGLERDELLTLARDAADPNWVATGVDRQLAALIEYERTAEDIIEAHPMLIPGLLQTREYARSIMISAGVNVGAADHMANIRMGRHNVLERQNPAQFVALIGEYALRYPACEPAIMADQLRQLLKWGSQDNVEIRAIPLEARWTPAHCGPCVIMTFPRARPVVHLEHFRSGVTLTDAKDVKDYRDAADTLRRAAMSPDRTSGLIAELANRWEIER